METFLWNNDRGWSGIFPILILVTQHHTVSQIESSSFTQYEQFEMWETDTAKKQLGKWLSPTTE